MNYRLPRQLLSIELSKLISCKSRGERLGSPSRRNLREMEAVVREIEERGCPRRFVRKRLPGKLGYGIFLHPQANAIAKGELIAPYAGELSIVPQNVEDNGDYAFAPVENFYLSREEQRVWDPKRRYHPKRIYAVKLDALKRGNFTRFINHSAKPNVEAMTFAVPRNRLGLAPSPVEILYLARKEILPGQQLMTCYDDAEGCYWGISGVTPLAVAPETFYLDKQLFLRKNSPKKGA